jgi:hypothetical protein
MWPSRDRRHRFPPIEFLIRNYAPPLKAPSPRPEKYLIDHALYLVAVTDATISIDEMMQAIEEKLKELNNLKDSMASFNRWKDASGKAGLSKRLTIEIHNMEIKLSEKKSYRTALVSKNERLVKLIDLQASMEAAYKDYMLDSQVTYEV